ncbi:MAG: MauE/DoxX family redox-associated membrane protein, partial [Phycisphaerae bacterium]
MLSGFAKVADSQGFITTVQAHGVVSAPTATFVASFLPWIEVLVGVGALWSAANGYGLRRSIFAAALLFGIFSAYAWFLVASPPTKP